MDSAQPASHLFQKLAFFAVCIVVVLLGVGFGLFIAPKDISYQLSPNPPMIEDQVSEIGIAEFESEVTALTNCTVSSSDVEMTSLEKAVFDEINSYRASLGLSQLKDSATIRNAAAWMSNDMAATKNFSHDDSTGRSFVNRMRDCGYSGATGEIIQRNPSTDAKFLVQKWKDSSGHDKIMKGTSHKVMGVAHKSGYWTVDFGRTEDSSGGTNPTSTPTRTPTPGSQSPTSTPTRTPTQSQDQPTPTPTGNQNPTPTGTGDSTSSIQVSATLFGVGQNSGASKPMSGTVTVYDLSGSEKLSQSVTLTYNSQNRKFEGAVSLPTTFVNGNYNVKLKAENTLRESINPYTVTLQTGRSNVLPTIILVAGDLNNDNKITHADYNLIVGCTPLSACNKPLYDLNYDNKITIEDYNVLLYAYSNIFGE